MSNIIYFPTNEADRKGILARKMLKEILRKQRKYVNFPPYKANKKGGIE